MAAAQAVGAAAILGSASTATLSGKGGGVATASGQKVCSIAPRSTVPVQPWPTFISGTSKLFPERSSSRNFHCAGENGHANAASQLDNATSAEAEITTAENSAPQPTAEQSSISALMAHVTSLVKLVDSRDIVELELKHKDYEIVIRKETQQPLPPPLTYPGPHVMAHTSSPGYPQAPSPPSPAPNMAVGSPPAAAAAAAPPPAAAKPSRPPMLSPMAGTFYRSPAPGEPPFVKVGDKVTKGQVVCIVEAMKLMNEIEADQSGTVTEILVETGKPIAIEAPLFLIEP